MLISVLIPCYNHEKYISSCLNSLLAQTYKNIELIIIDDSSTDNSFQIIQEYFPRLENSFLRVYVNRNVKNLGVTKTLNKMIHIAKGEYIKLLASDDMLLPSAILDFSKAVQTSKAEIIFSNVAFVPENFIFDGTCITEQISSLPVRYNTRPLEGKNLTGKLCGDNFISAPGVLIPRRTFERYGVFDEAYILEDFDFWLRVSVSGSFEYLNRVTALYRENDNSLSRFDISPKSIKRHADFFHNKLAIFNRYKHYASLEEIAQFYNNELNSSIGTNDIKTTSTIIKLMNNDKIRINFYNKARLPIVYLGLYPLLKKIKMKYKKR